MSTFAVIGGTGTLGRPLVAELRRRGLEVRVLSRGSAEHPVDLVSGQGLGRALAGVDVIVNAANGPPSRRAEAVLVDGTRRMLEISPAHHVCVSIVGIEDVPMGYYGVKVAQEEAVRASGRPWTIVRATQFHELLGRLVQGTARFRIALRSQALFQPVAVSEVATALADFAQTPRPHATLSVAGPEVLSLSQLGGAAGPAGPAIPLPVPLPPRIGRALRAGALTTQTPDVQGTITFARWLSTRRPRA